MRFSQLPVGQRFEFEGVRYVKTGPLIAAEEAGSKTRFIAKYALVQSLGGDDSAPQPAATTLNPADAAAVAAAFDEFYRQARAIVETLGAEADAATFSRAQRSGCRASRVPCGAGANGIVTGPGTDSSPRGQSGAAKAIFWKSYM